MDDNPAAPTPPDASSPPSPLDVAGSHDRASMTAREANAVNGMAELGEDGVPSEAAPVGSGIALDLGEGDVANPAESGLESASERAERRERVGKATYAIAAFSILGRLLGYVEKSLVAMYAGSSVSGAYFAASNVPWGIFSFVEQLLTHSFLPPFVETREKRGEESAWNLASLVATVVFLVLGVIVIVGMVKAPWIVQLYSRGFTAKEIRLTVLLTRIMLPAVVLMSVSSLTYVILNAYKQFGLPAFADAALKIGIVVGAVALWRYLGIAAFAVGLILGAFIKLAVHLYGLRRKLRLARWTLDGSDPAAKKLLVLMLPLMLGNLLSVIRPFLDVWFCGGSSEYAALKFAFTLTNLPFILIPYALGIALFPFLSEMAARGDREGIGRALVSAFRMVSFLLVPITALYLVLALPMVETVFMHGKFTAADAGRVVAPLVWYSIGMLAFGMETVILQVFFSLSDTQTPTIVAYGTFVLYLVVGYFSTTRLMWGAVGVAIALTASKLVKDVVLAGILIPRLGGIDLRGLGGFLLRLAAATAALVAVAGLMSSVGYHAPSTPIRPSAAAPATTAAAPPSGRVAVHAASSGTAAKKTAKPKKTSRTKKLAAVKVFVLCAAPGAALFGLVAYWLRIPELFTLYGVLERRLRPVLFRLTALAMAPW